MGRGKEHAAEYRVLMEMLRDLRTDAGLTQAELASVLRKPQSYVSKIERGERLIDPMELRHWCRSIEADIVKLVREWDRRLMKGEK